MDESRRWCRAVARLPHVRLLCSRAFALVGRCSVWRRRREAPLVACVGGLFSTARARRDGAGRREDDADGRCISRSKANVANHPCRLAAGQRSWLVPYRVPLSLGVEIRGGVAGPPHGSWNCEDIAMCSRAALPAALRDLPGVCGNRGVPFWYASGQLVSSAPHGPLMTE